MQEFVKGENQLPELNTALQFHHKLNTAVLISSPSPRLDVNFCGTPIIVLFLGCLPFLAVSQLSWLLTLEALPFSQAGLQPVPGAWAGER